MLSESEVVMLGSKHGERYLKDTLRIPDVARGGQDSEINWEDACSLGEKQRLAIARLIWHKPQFA